MLKVVVSEKNGPDRVYFFEDITEVSIGRLQSNRIVLPKPNISKRHAVLKVVESGVLVEDLGSTNGTYVNGRRISAPRLITPEDRIYVGDFTIRARLVSSKEEVSQPAAVIEQALSTEGEMRPTLAMPAMDLSEEKAGAEKAVFPPLPPKEELSAPEIVPLELEVEIAQPREREPTAAPTEPPERPAAAPVGPGLSSPVASRKVMQAATVAQSDPYLAALRMIAERAATEVFDLVPPNKSDFGDDEWNALADRVLRLVDQMRRENAIPAGPDAYQLTQDVLDDFAGLGPLEELLQDPGVRRILVNGPDCIFATRGGQTTKARRGFSCPEAFERVLIKIGELAGFRPAEVKAVVEGHLPDGTHVILLRPPLVAELAVMMLTRPAGSLLEMRDLVKAGLMSEQDLEAINRAVEKRDNIVICGPPNVGKMVFLNAVVRVLPAESRVVIIERGREVVIPGAEAVRLQKDYLSCGEGPEGPCIVSRLMPDAVVISDVDVGDARLLTSLALAGQKGVILALTADGVTSCLHRLQMLLGFANPSVDSSIIRSLVDHFVDLVVALAFDEEGRTRVSEVLAVRD